MFKIATSLLATTPLLLTTPFARAQGEGFPENLVNGCVVDFDPDVDYFPNKYERPLITSYGDTDIFGDKFVPHNTTDLLEITYHNTYKIVTNKFQNVSYLLYQCGTEPPQDEIDSGRHHLVLPIPHKGGVAVTQTPQIPPLEMLGLREEILAYIDNPQWVSSPCLTHMFDQGDVEQVYIAGNSTAQAEAVAEWLVQNPEAIIFRGPYGDKEGDRVVVVAASQERTNVATFDWIAMFSAFFNLEGMANKIRADTQAQYECSSENARIIAAQSRKLKKEEAERKLVASVPTTNLREPTAANAPRELEEDKPVLLWARWIQGYNWSVAECPTWDTTYYCEYAAHCDIEIISRPEGLGWNNPDFGGRYWYLNDDEMLALGKDADVWIYASQYWDSMYEVKKDLVDQFKAVQNQQVYDTQGMGPNSWYEQRLAEYDVVGLDVCAVAGRSNPNGPPHEVRWLRNIFTEDVGSLEECRIPEKLSEPYIPGGADCVPLKLDIPSGDDVPSESGEDGEGNDDEKNEDESWSSPISSLLVTVVSLVAVLSATLEF